MLFQKLNNRCRNNYIVYHLHCYFHTKERGYKAIQQDLAGFLAVSLLLVDILVDSMFGRALGEVEQNRVVGNRNILTHSKWY